MWKEQERHEKSQPLDASTFTAESLNFSPLSQIAVVLSHTSHPGNIGAAARAMKTMGLTDLRLVNPEVFPSDIASVRASGATDVLDAARVFASLADAIADCVYVVGSSARGRDFVGEVQDARTASTELVARSVRGKSRSCSAANRADSQMRKYSPAKRSRSCRPIPNIRR